MNWRDDYEQFKEDIRNAQEQAKRTQEGAQQRKQAEMDPMAELAKLANSTHSVGEHVWFENQWGCYIQRSEGERRFKFTQIRPGNSSALHYIELTPVQVVREMYKVSQYV